MWRTDSFEKILMLGTTEGRRRRGQRGWDGWMASLTRRTWVWASSRNRWWTGNHGVLQSMGSQKVGHDWATELKWTVLKFFPKELSLFIIQTKSIKNISLILNSTTMDCFKYLIKICQFIVLVCIQFNSAQSLSRVQLFATPWTAARQASLSITNSQSLLKLMSICITSILLIFLPIALHKSSYFKRIDSISDVCWKYSSPMCALAFFL